MFGSVDKSEYVDTIVFLKDLKKIYLNGEYFGGEDLSVDYEYIENVTLGELISLKTIKKLIPGQKYNITNYHTEIDDAVGVVSYNENEKHHIVVQALTNLSALIFKLVEIGCFFICSAIIMSWFSHLLLFSCRLRHRCRSHQLNRLC